MQRHGLSGPALESTRPGAASSRGCVTREPVSVASVPGSCAPRAGPSGRRRSSGLPGTGLHHRCELSLSLRGASMGPAPSAGSPRCCCGPRPIRRGDRHSFAPRRIPFAVLSSTPHDGHEVPRPDSQSGELPAMTCRPRHGRLWTSVVGAAKIYPRCSSSFRALTRVAADPSRLRCRCPRVGCRSGVFTSFRVDRITFA